MLSMGTSRRAHRTFARQWRLHALSIFTLAVAFVCLGAALLVVTNLRAVEDRWAHAGRASVYLRDGASPDDIEALRAALTHVPGVLAARYVSPGEARAEFGRREVERNRELAGLPVETFPASIEVEIQPSVTDAELTDLVTKAKALPSVDDVETYQSWTERLSRLVGGGVAASALLAVVVLAAVLAVVGSTMRLALQRRQTEVEVLKLVGATDSFVRRPFVIEGSLQGALGAAGAIALLGLLFLVVRGRLDGELASLVGIDPSFLPWYAVLAMVALGGALGAVAALTSLRKLVSV
jgi:cell division transport system permease protein